MSSEPKHQSSSKQEAKCIGFRDALEESRVRRESKPQPWIARKLAVGIVLAVWVYAYYVFIGRLVFEMVRPNRNERAFGSRAEGIGLAVGFNILWVMFGWCYAMTVLTSPGYAKHHAKKEPRPNAAHEITSRPSWDSDDRDTIAGPRYGSEPPNSPTLPNGHTSLPANPPSPTSPTRSHRSVRRASSTEANARPLDTVPHPTLPIPIHNTTLSPQRTEFPPTEEIQQGNILPPLPSVSPPPVSPTQEQNQQHQQTRQTQQSVDHQVPFMQTASSWFGRSPPQHGALLPEYRYCSKEGFVKPLRSHHCRSCGKCVLQYDHHCPWIGQCVGARNRRFFIIFLIWCTLITLYIFITVLIFNVRNMNRRDAPVDAPQIVLIALAGFFSLFSITLLISQVHLVLLNMTTVEHLSVRSQHERESAILSRQFSPLACGKRRKVKKVWDAEWGRPGYEGNIWWLGSRRRNWEATFGTNKLFWILPLGKDMNDGLSYPVNPRFDSKGRWRPRREWPRELQELPVR